VRPSLSHRMDCHRGRAMADLMTAWASVGGLHLHATIKGP